MGAFTRYVEQFGNTVAERLAGMALEAIRNKALDPSHHPFKRSEDTGPAQGGGGVTQQRHWECRRGAEKYEQLCTYVGPEGHGIRRGYVKTVRVGKLAKKKYNHEYEKHLKKHGMKAPHNNANALLPDYVERESNVAKISERQRARWASLKKAAKVPKAKTVKAAKKTVAKKTPKAKKVS